MKIKNRNRVLGVALILAGFFWTNAAASNNTESLIVSTSDSNDVYSIVDVMPEIVGGISTLYGLIEYPGMAKQNGVQGRVYIQFIIDESGNVLEPKVIKDIGAGCGEAALDAIKQISFSPGLLNGAAVKVRYTLPVNFKIEN